jgi:hypothetical protein
LPSTLVNKLKAPQIKKTKNIYKIAILMNEKNIDALEFNKNGLSSSKMLVVL